MPEIIKGETFDCRGTARFTSAESVQFKDNSIPRSNLVEDSLAEHTLRLDDLRVWDDLTSLLPGTAATDDLAIIEGTFGTDSPTIQTSDAKATTVTQRLRFLYTLPRGYKAGQDINIRIRGGMVTTVSDTTATVDVECYAHDDDGAVGSDLCTTSAATINSLTKANRDFVITSTGLSAGDTLDVRVTVAITDGATGTAVIGELSKITLLLDSE